jgi:CopG family nickel-responsive transcriptional regulator
MVERIKRIGVSMEPDLLARLDEFVDSKEFPSRSEAIRDMVMDRLSAEKLQNPSEQAVGSITILYNPHARGLSDKLTEFQHEGGNHDLIISMTHIHVGEDLCLEILVCRGRAGDIRNLAEKISAIKGVRHGEVSMRSVAETEEHHRLHPHTH